MRVFRVCFQQGEDATWGHLRILCNLGLQSLHWCQNWCNWLLIVTICQALMVERFVREKLGRRALLSERLGLVNRNIATIATRLAATATPRYSNIASRTVLTVFIFCIFPLKCSYWIYWFQGIGKIQSVCPGKFCLVLLTANKFWPNTFVRTSKYWDNIWNANCSVRSKWK